MRKILNIPIDSVIPPEEIIFKHQGIPQHIKVDERKKELFNEAISIFRKLASPIGIVMELTKEEFNDVFVGEGRNEIESPVNPIFKNADDLALFAVTTDENICSEISRLFGTNDFALGSMLDAVASEATEMTARAMENFYCSHLKNIGRFKNTSSILRFSPGYCGWHVSGQRKLFQHLHPKDIGIKLRERFLMEPLKSISGVIISGKKEIFQFDDTFSFCGSCATHECRERIIENRR
ncbi:MAG: vitamin B12 dependent-methionine synthase activation domain-containing protein [Bacteroidota bacterium]|nr:vitamin B12 dependent-methionine synthase activation domain-containing protein [Bacteroidota bacterium]